MFELSKPKDRPDFLPQIINEDSGFTPRLEIGYGLSKCVQEGVSQVGNYCFDRSKDLGKTLHAFIISFRFLAIELDGTEMVARSMNPESNTYKQLFQRSKTRQPQGTTVNVGRDVLIYIFEVGQVATFHFGKYYNRSLGANISEPQSPAHFKTTQENLASGMPPEQAYVGSLLGRCTRWEVNTENKQNKAGTKYQLFKPKVEFVPDDAIKDKFGTPDPELIIQAEKQFRDEAIAPEPEASDEPVDR